MENVTNININYTISIVPDAIKFYFSLIILPIGILLNILSARVFFKYILNNNSTNMGLLYGCLSCLNVVALVNLLIFNILDYNDYNYHYSAFTCKFLNVWEKVVLHFPSFQQVLIAFYLWLSICFPNKYKAALNKTWYFEMALFAYVMLMSWTNLAYYMGLDESLSSSLGNISNQSLVCTAENEFDFASDCIYILNRAILPCILIFWLNTLSLKKIVEMGKKFNNEKKSSNFMRAVIGMNFVFLLVYLPWGIVFLIHHITSYLNNDPDNSIASSLVNQLSFQLTFSICDCISYLNNIAPFFLNLAFNTMFRKEIFYLLNIKQSMVSQTLVSSKKSNLNGKVPSGLSEA
jgi:hypothetical protein